MTGDRILLTIIRNQKYLSDIEEQQVRTGVFLWLRGQSYPHGLPDMRKPSVLNGEGVFTHNIQTPPRHALKKTSCYNSSWPLKDAQSTLTDAQQPPITRLCLYFTSFTRKQNESLCFLSDTLVDDNNTLHGSHPRLVQFWPAWITLQKE